jgi:hypothetical protein
MEILKADPLASFSGILDELKSNLILSTTHCELMEALTANN